MSDQSKGRITYDSDDDVLYWRPEDIPPNLTPLERAMIVARNVRRWANFLLEEGPAPRVSDELTDVGEPDGNDPPA
jgi:hypothetical protein